MPIDNSTDDLISSIKIRTMMPGIQELFPNADICRVAGEVLRTKIVPAILKINEEFWVTAYDQAITAGQADYKLPVRSAYSKLVDVVGVESNGDEFELNRIDSSEVPNLRSPFSDGVLRYEIVDDAIRIRPTPTSTDGRVVRMKYERRPGRLCLLGTDAFKVTGYTSGTGVALGVSPAAWTAATPVDVIRSDGSFRYIATDRALSAVSAGVSVTLSPALTDALAGHYIAEAGYSPIPQIPEEGHPWLAQETAVELLSFHNDKAVKNAAAIAADKAEQFLSTIAPRIKNAPRRIPSGESPFNWA